MQDNPKKPMDGIQTKKPEQSNIDYSPKTYNKREQIIYSMKFMAITGTILLIFWLLEKYAAH